MTGAIFVIFTLLGMMMGAVITHAVEGKYWRGVIAEWQRAHFHHEQASQREFWAERGRTDAMRQSAIAIQMKLEEAQQTIAVLYERLLLKSTLSGATKADRTISNSSTNEGRNT